MGDAALAGDHAAARRPLAGAAGGAERRVHRQHDIGDPGLVRMPGQAIAAAGAAHALDQISPAQAREQLLQVGQRDFLAPRDLGEGHRPLAPVAGEIGHGHDRISALGAQTHGVSPESARISGGLC